MFDNGEEFKTRWVLVAKRFKAIGCVMKVDDSFAEVVKRVPVAESLVLNSLARERQK